MSKMKLHNICLACIIFIVCLSDEYCHANTNLSFSNDDETKTQPDSSANLNNINNGNKPYIDGDHIVNATRGQMATMKCVVNNVKNYKIAWYFNGILLTLNNIRIKDDKRYSVENLQPNEWKLIIDPVNSKNEGEYSCRLTNGMKRSIYLKVGVPPVFTENNGSHQIVINTPEKQNITLSCEAQGNPLPSIFWYRNDKLIATGPHLKLHDVNRHSHSEYECVARNSIEPAPSRHFKINVNFEPTLKLMYHLKEHNKNLHKGSMSDELESQPHAINDGDLQLVCEINGNPINHINWYKDGSLIKDDSKRHIGYRYIAKTTTTNVELIKRRKKFISIHTTQLNSHKFISKLKIKNFDFTDNGVYKCAANGLEGDASKSLTINEINQSNENEYSLNVAHKNSNLKKNFSHLKNRKLSNELVLDEKLKDQLAESSFLMHGRGARSNSTSIEEIGYNTDSENSVAKFKLDSLLGMFCLIGVMMLNN